MRLEDWQKWLDTQFIDPAATETAPEPPAELAPAAGPAVAHNGSKPPQPIVDAIVVEQPAASPPAQPAPTAAREATGLVDDVEIPSIERYLPFLRGANPPPAPAAGAVEEQPAQVEVRRSENRDAASLPVEIEESSHPPVSGGVTSEIAATPAKTVVIGEPAAATTPGADRVSATERDEADRAEEPAPAESSAPSAPQAESAHRLVRRAATGHHRTRPAKHTDPAEIAQNLADGGLWDLVPKHIQALVALGSEEVAQNSYKREFRESRIELIGRILDPTLSLEETARILNVCPTTVRRYTNRGLLTHQRTHGDQRRFKLSDVLAFLETQSRPGGKEGV